MMGNMLNLRDIGIFRSICAEPVHFIDDFFRSGKYRLNGSVAPVLHPTIKPKPTGCFLCPTAIPHALDTAVDNDLDCLVHLGNRTGRFLPL